jgi:tetratricopeptide (TPR) repeat protein
VLVDSRVKIGQALSREAQQRQRAETAYRLAREGFQHSLDIVTKDPRLQAGPLEDLRRAVRGAEKEFYERFLQLQGNDPAFQLERLRAHRRLANVTQELGSKEEAVEHYRHAASLAARLAADYPGVTEYQSDLFVCYNNLGEMLRLVGRPGEGERPLLDSLIVARSLVRDHPGVAEYKRDLARSYSNLGSLRRDMNRPNEAEQSFNSALTLLKASIADHPKDPDLQSELARTYSELARYYRDMGRANLVEQAFVDCLAIHRSLNRDHPEVAEYRLEVARDLSNLAAWYWESKAYQKSEQCLEEAIGLMTALVKEHPGVAEYRDWLAIAQGNLSITYQSAGRIREAEQAEREALALMQKLVDDFPTFPSYQHRLGIILNNLAMQFLQSNPAETRRLAEQAIDHQRAALKPNDRNPIYRRYLWNHHDVLAQALLRLADHEAAARAAAEVMLLEPDDWQAYAGAAALLAGCVPMAEKDAKLPENKRRELARSYARRAVEMLREAIKKGFSDGKSLTKDPEFQSLHPFDEFKKLVQDLDGK